MCGKNKRSISPPDRPQGSPPRVREKLFAMLSAYGASRITPACAGKTSPNCSQSTQVEDHPRVCGKNRRTSCVSCRKRGSPPRVREKLRNIYIFRLVIGITPACAGKTILHSSRPDEQWDHPRVCGKNRDCRPATH